MTHAPTAQRTDRLTHRDATLQIILELNEGILNHIKKII